MNTCTECHSLSSISNERKFKNLIYLMIVNGPSLGDCHSDYNGGLQGSLSMTTTEEVVKYIQEYYPRPKLDQVSNPGFFSPAVGLTISLSSFRLVVYRHGPKHASNFYLET